MKYFIYSYTWTSDDSAIPVYATGYFQGKSIVDLYHDTLIQSERYNLTHVAEVTQSEFRRAMKIGLIG